MPASYAKVTLCFEVFWVLRVPHWETSSCKGMVWSNPAQLLLQQTCWKSGACLCSRVPSSQVTIYHCLIALLQFLLHQSSFDFRFFWFTQLLLKLPDWKSFYLAILSLKKSSGLEGCHLQLMLTTEIPPTSTGSFGFGITPSKYSCRMEKKNSLAQSRIENIFYSSLICFFFDLPQHPGATALSQRNRYTKIQAGQKF